MCVRETSQRVGGLGGELNFPSPSQPPKLHRAAEIASTFSAGIASFEQRLLKLEAGVQQELQELRSSVAENDASARLVKLEKGMKAVLDKLSAHTGD